MEHHSIYRNDGNMELPESFLKLSELSSRSKWNSAIDARKMLVHDCRVGVGIINFIPTEDEIKSPEDVSIELVEHTKKISADFLNMILKPFADGVLQFLEKHPEYEIQNLETRSGVESGCHFSCRQDLNDLFDMLKGE